MARRTVKVTRKRKPTGTIVIDSEENDDWMKSLPGYQDEVKIHEQLAKKYAREEGGTTKRKGRAVKKVEPQKGKAGL